MFRSQSAHVRCNASSSLIASSVPMAASSPPSSSPLAGRSPSYTVRQLFDLQHGTRRGPWAPLMQAAVQKLTLDDMVAIAAYTASLKP